MSIHAVYAWGKIDVTDVEGGHSLGEDTLGVPIRIFCDFAKVREVEIEIRGVLTVLELAFVTGNGMFKLNK